MSRRKQAKPQYVITDPKMENFPGPTCDVHICEQCCAEFADITDLHQHLKNCLKDQLVVIVSANESPDSPPSMLTGSLSHLKTEEELDGGTNINDSEELAELSSDETSVETNKSFDIFDDRSYDVTKKSSPHHDIANNDYADDLSSAFPTVLHQEDCVLELCKTSAVNSNVFIENLKNTKVAVAQFLQENSSSPKVISRDANSSTMAASGLIEQLLALQQQQVQQLNLIEEIQQQILLLTAQNTDTHVASPLIKLSSNVSEQLAAASELAENLASQFPNAKESKNISQTSQDDSRSDKENSQVTDKNKDNNSMLLKVSSNLCSNQSLHNNQVTDKTGGLTHLKEQSTSSALITDGILNKLELPHKQNAIDIFANTLPSIGAIVEDLNALTALAQRRKEKSPNVTLFDNKRPSEDCILKHKCRFCTKVFGSDSALQIHLRSHTGERPYKCNICGNRFSTRGNLKVHFQRHKEKYPNIQMNPYPVPEHLDNIPTNTGIPYGMSLPPEKTGPNWIDDKHLEGRPNSVGYMLSSSLPSIPTIKKEKPQSPVGISKGHQERSSTITPLILNEKFQEVTQASSLANFVSISGESSRNHTATNTSTDSRLITELKLEQLESKFIFGRLPDFPGSSETLMLERLVKNIDKKSSDPNECVICNRVLSCQSALKMHYRTHTGERPFKCRVCGRAFTTKGNLKTHYSIHRSMPSLRIQHSCPICQEKFTNAMVLQQHVHMHMGGHIPNLPLHDKYPDSMDQDTDLPEGKNIKVDDSVDYMEIGKEALDYKYPDPILDSLRSSPSRLTGLECPISSVDNCSKSKFIIQNGSMHGDCLTQISSSSPNGDYDSKNTETAHIWKPSSPNSSTLETDKYSTSDQNLTSSSASSESNSLSLSQLNLRLLDGPSGDMSKDNMTMIFSVSERETLKSNVCDICSKTFACQSALDIHYRSHTKERPFICSECNRGFSTKGNLKQHMLTHQMRDLPAQLFESANQIFPTTVESIIPLKRTELNGFIKKDPKDSTVAVVSSSVSTLPTLSTAAPLRRSAKQHFCHTCGKTFSSSSALQIHERTHTGEKPFACNICGRAFTTKGNLKVHMGTHMWSSSPARRGRRLSIDGPFLKANPEIFQNSPPKDAVGRMNSRDTVGLWSHFASLTSGLAIRANEIPVIQNGAIPYLSMSAGHLDNLEKLQLNRAFTLTLP